MRSRVGPLAIGPPLPYPQPSEFEPFHVDTLAGEEVLIVRDGVEHAWDDR